MYSITGIPGKSVNMQSHDGLNNIAGVHVPGPTIRVNTNVAYVTNKPVRYVVIVILLCMVRSEQWTHYHNTLIVKKVR